MSADRARKRLAGRAVAAATAASAVIVGLGGAPADAAAQLGCGSVVTTSVTLSADITGCSGDGLVIGASDITIDLNRYRLTGAGNGSVTGIGSGKGISNPGGYDRVSIRNGRIENFLFGVRLTDTTKSEVSNVTFNKVLYGVYLVNSHDSVVADNALIGLRDGDAGKGVSVEGDRNGVYRNTLRDFQWMGIEVDSDANGTRVVKNTVSVGGDGIFAGGRETAVQSNRVQWNRQRGIVVRGPHYENGMWYEPSALLKANTADGNGWDGIKVSSTKTTVTDNLVTNNTYRGIEGTPGMNDGGGNRASGNGSTPPCTYVACS